MFTKVFFKYCLGVGPITIAFTNLVGELQTFYTAVKNLRADGGGDGPEYALYAMDKGLNVTEGGIDIIGKGSQMVVITDAPSKQPMLKSQVIRNANDKGVCIHFFVAGTYALSDNAYQDIANETSGNVIYPYSNWKLAEFIVSYRDRRCGHLPPSIREKRQISEIFIKCQSFSVPEFSELLKATITAESGQTVRITQPNLSSKNVITGGGNLALFSEASPMAGIWNACVDRGTIEVFTSNSIVLDTTVIYTDRREFTSSIPPSACKKIIIVYYCNTTMAQTLAL